MHVSLRLKSDILLSALCASRLTKLELDLRPGWDNVGVFKVVAKKEGKKIMVQIEPLDLCFHSK